MQPHAPLPPGSRIGIIGGGQLGRMTAIAAAHMGYRVTVLDPDPDCPAAQVADDHIASPYEDRDAAREFGKRSDVVTYEFENVDAGAADAAGELALVYPSSRVLRTAQDRILEKASLNAAGFPVTPYRRVGSAEEFQAAIGAIGLPAVLKTARMGYDGKGQAVIESAAGADHAFEGLMGSGELILEQFVPFEKELSVICARDARGNTRPFPCAENVHVNGILDLTIAPARVSHTVAKAAAELAAGIASHLDVVGLIAVEMFLTDDDRLLVNELAPRPHNSGHHTIEASPDLAVRAIGAGAVWSSAGRRFDAAACGDGQPARRCVARVRRPTRLRRRAVAVRRVPSPIRQGGSPFRPQDGASDRRRKPRRTGAFAGHHRPKHRPPPRPRPTLNLKPSLLPLPADPCTRTVTGTGQLSEDISRN